MTDIGFSLEDLGLSSRSVGPGRKAANVTAEFARELTVSELAMPQVGGPIQAPKIKSLRDTHHALARCLATGMAEAEASVVTGYSLSRISILKADPQFSQLLDHYRSLGGEYVADMRKRMADVGLNALGELQERLEDRPEDFSPGLLKDIVKDLADRTGHAPQRGPTSVTQINIGLSERIAKARERVQRISGPIIEGEVQ